MYTLLKDAKKHLQIDDDYKDDDRYIQFLIDVAEDAVAKRINDPLEAIIGDDGLLPASVRHCILIIIGNLYANRESIAYGSAVEVPHTLEYLAGFNKRYSF